MPESIVLTIKKVMQDLVAADVRELKTLVVDLQKQIDQRFDAQDKKSGRAVKGLEPDDGRAVQRPHGSF